MSIKYFKPQRRTNRSSKIVPKKFSTKTILLLATSVLSWHASNLSFRNYSLLSESLANAQSLSYEQLEIQNPPFPLKGELGGSGVYNNRKSENSKIFMILTYQNKSNRSFRIDLYPATPFCTVSGQCKKNDILFLAQDIHWELKPGESKTEAVVVIPATDNTLEGDDYQPAAADFLKPYMAAIKKELINLHSKQELPFPHESLHNSN